MLLQYNYKNTNIVSDAKHKTHLFIFPGELGLVSSPWFFCLHFSGSEPLAIVVLYTSCHCCNSAVTVGYSGAQKESQNTDPRLHSPGLIRSLICTIALVMNRAFAAFVPALRCQYQTE